MGSLATTLAFLFFGYVDTFTYLHLFRRQEHSNAVSPLPQYLSHIIFFLQISNSTLNSEENTTMPFLLLLDQALPAEGPVEIADPCDANYRYVEGPNGFALNFIFHDNIYTTRMAITS